MRVSPLDVLVSWWKDCQINHWFRNTTVCPPHNVPVTNIVIGHFWVTLCLCFIVSPRVKPIAWKQGWLPRGTHCARPENIHTPPTEGIRISWGGGGLSKTQKVKEICQASFNCWNFQRGGGDLGKNPFSGGGTTVWIFSGTTCFHMSGFTDIKTHFASSCRKSSQISPVIC